ncbi:MAG: lyase family protein, partial [Pseudomonadales bacterium]
MSYRVESDSMGALQVPQDALYGAQTQRAVNNFAVSAQAMPEAFIRALLQAKSAAASANAELGHISAAMASAIVGAAAHLLQQDDLMTHFPVDIYQTGSGTSSNMNANEVLAALATQALGETVGANDHVNFGQSSNDIIPSTIHISAAIEIERKLLPALEHLNATIQAKAAAVDQHIKTGRTHLMDAMPVRMSQSLLSWSGQITQHLTQLAQQKTLLHRLAQGGTAVGTGINADPAFSALFCQKLQALTEIPFTPADNLFTAIGTQDAAVMISGQLKAIAVSVMKISNDLRWMNSGPLAGIGEIALPSLQPG